MYFISFTTHMFLFFSDKTESSKLHIYKNLTGMIVVHNSYLGGVWFNFQLHHLKF
jgi:hypothetical protein